MPTSFTPSDLTLIRRAYAHQLIATYPGTDHPALERAFATIPRENFLPPPPWRTMILRGEYEPITLTDLVTLYQDIVIALDPEHGVNNGSPSLHIRWITALSPRPTYGLIAACSERCTNPIKT